MIRRFLLTQKKKVGNLIVFVRAQKKKCVAYPLVDFLFISQLIIVCWLLSVYVVFHVQIMGTDRGIPQTHKWKVGA
jgi:hypothetical protein